MRPKDGSVAEGCETPTRVPQCDMRSRRSFRRGREQAEVVEERLLTPILRQAAEAPHAL